MSIKRFLVVSTAALGGAAFLGLSGLVLGAVGSTQIARRLTRKQGRACHSLTCIHFHQEGVPKQELGPFRYDMAQPVQDEGVVTEAIGTSSAVERWLRSRS